MGLCVPMIKHHDKRIGCTKFLTEKNKKKKYSGITCDYCHSVTKYGFL